MKHRESWTVPEVTQHILQHLQGSTQLSFIALMTVTLCCARRCATDHNVDNTTGMLQEWLAAMGRDYATVVWKPEDEARWLTEGAGGWRTAIPQGTAPREGEVPLL